MRTDFRDGGPYDVPWEANLLVCPHCRLRCSLHASFCPHCTHPIPEDYRDKYSRWLGNVLFRCGRVPVSFIIYTALRFLLGFTQEPEWLTTTLMFLLAPIWAADMVNFFFGVRFLLVLIPIWTLLLVWSQCPMTDGGRLIALGSSAAAWKIAHWILPTR